MILFCMLYFHTELIMWTTLFLLLCIAQFTKVIYYFTPDNQFVRGPWYPLLIIQIFVSAFLLIVVAVSVSALSMFGIIVADLAEQNTHQRQKIADQRANCISAHDHSRR
ncbi:MAG: hypothetical protein IKQ25_14660 [Lachnospiraceae bacterium]|nr:hypothetical protein [Lachnospiraceae bacterium]